MDRRTFLAAAAATPFATPLAAQDIPAMRARALAVLDTLSEVQTKAIMFDFDHPRRKRWNYMLGSARAPGVGLEDMNPTQKEAALGLLATALSPAGFEKAQNIMLQQDILRDEWGKGSADRNAERFSLMLFGKPSADAPWAWRWEGHHLSLTFTLMGDKVVSITPNSFSSEPNTVPSGPHKGLVVLKEEEALARSLFLDLKDKARTAALVDPRAPGNVLTVKGQENRYDGDTRGLALADMHPAQRDMATRLLDVYLSEPFARDLAAEQQGRIGAHDVDATRFIWAGADLDGAIYYRLHGPTFLIEFASLRNQPLHLHTAVHDLERNHGGALV